MTVVWAESRLLNLELHHGANKLLQQCHSSKEYYLLFQLFFLYSSPLPLFFHHAQVSRLFYGHDSHEHVH